MCCKRFWKRVIPFTITVVISLLAVSSTKYFFPQSTENIKSSDVIIAFNGRENIGASGGCHRKTSFEELISSRPPKISDSSSAKLKILRKPRAQYTDIARQNYTTGIVRIRAKFSASGIVTDIYPISSLPDGLTDQAVKAATQIEFQPEIRNGRPISVVKVVEYSFNIY